MRRGRADDEGTLTNRFGELMQQRHELATAGRFDAFEQIEERDEMGRTTARRDLSDNAIGDTGEADGVALLDGEIGESGGNAFGEIDLLDVAGAEGHRAAGVDHEAEAEGCVGFRVLDVVTVGAAEGAPIEAAEVVARDVLAILGELDARAAVRADVSARDVALHRFAREQGQPGQPCQGPRVEETAALAFETHGFRGAGIPACLNRMRSVFGRQECLPHARFGQTIPYR